MDQIAQEMGISKKTIYQYFKDKRALVLEATKASFAQEEKMIAETVQQSSNAVQELFLISQHIRQKLSRIHPFILSDLKKYYRNAWDMFQQCKSTIFESQIFELLERGIQEGHFRKDINPRILTVMRMTQVEMVFDQETFPADKFDFKEVQMQILDHFVHGILTDKGRKVYNQYLLENHEAA
jgi:AcrR family transcriptional regulator